MKVQSIQSTNPAFNGKVAVKNLNSGIVKTFQLTAKEDKQLLDFFTPNSRKNSPFNSGWQSAKENMKSHLQTYLQSLSAITKDSEIKALADAESQTNRNYLEIISQSSSYDEETNFFSIKTKDYEISHELLN